MVSAKKISCPEEVAKLSYKGGNYELVGLGKHSETQEELVIYRALYGDKAIWVRPRKMFFEPVVVDGKGCPDLL